MRGALAFLALALLDLTTVGFAQVSANVSLSNGVQLSIATHTDNGATPAWNASLEPATGNSFYRIFRDENNLAVFAYELEVVRTSDGENLRVTAKLATDDFARRFPNADGGKPTPTLSTAMQSPVLSSGQTFTIPIPTNPGLGQNLTDVVQVRLAQRGGGTAGGQGSAQIRFSGLKVSINGNPASPQGAGADVAGKYAMFYIPGHGGYFFSAEPTEPAPFAHVGVVDGKRLTFTIDNEMYVCSADSPILVHSDGGQVWVFHNPSYKPAGNWTKNDPASPRDEFFAAAADSMKWWLQ
ncbi:MAG TPA: hypothetical protein VFW44_13225 [Bryobacteraceae bacterium]|nr:hypothetical protein [Bryobacteraceae bacterium]